MTCPRCGVENSVAAGYTHCDGCTFGPDGEVVRRNRAAMVQDMGEDAYEAMMRQFDAEAERLFGKERIDQMVADTQAKMRRLRMRRP
jgi:hypothetical protein